ncbi:response regulator transcription factor [Candidatus Dojkabacteria bacterium]|uniref:Response regulator transcription factor n=1 Tax=Candidatus Dojkabacteria bacterium TaxID=2099670 RepID=A0A955I6K1_9BACT|nr:response regulator transcription factor [Candidatus Dojkabacteria bacterium]
MNTRILIVEDEELLAQALQLKLSKAGHTVSIAEDGEIALSKLEQDQKYDLMILDLAMPTTNGFTVLEKIKDADYRPADIIVLSNLSSPEDHERVTALGVPDNHILTKAKTPLSQIVSYVNDQIKISQDMSEPADIVD